MVAVTVAGALFLDFEHDLKVSGRGEFRDVWNGGAHVLIWGLKFGADEIIWGLKFTIGEVIWGLIFPCLPERTSSLKISGKQLASHEYPPSKSQGVLPGSKLCFQNSLFCDYFRTKYLKF